MSFKREGDDQSQLNVLKKRRVADLLSNFIPEDEATLLKNGRYSCLVCSYRPVFDTVDMLTIHRKGKKHLGSLKWFYGKKTDLQKEIGKRQHQEYVNKEDGKQETATSAPLLTQTRNITHHALLRSTPYSSCHKKAGERSEAPVTQLNVEKKNAPVNHQTFGQIIIPTAKTKTDTSDTSPADATATHANQCFNENQMKKKRSRSKAANTPESEPLSEQRRKELEHYLKLKSAGWLQDPGGNWVKDQNVEFDSDEEEPLPLPHTDTI